MDAQKAIFIRRTIHSFENKKVSNNIIRNAIEAANQAPCHKLTYPWRFYSVGEKKRKEILDLAMKIKSQNKKIDDKSKDLIFDILDKETLTIINSTHDPLSFNADYRVIINLENQVTLVLQETLVGLVIQWLKV